MCVHTCTLKSMPLAESICNLIHKGIFLWKAVWNCCDFYARRAQYHEMSVMEMGRFHIPRVWINMMSDDLFEIRDPGSCHVLAGPLINHMLGGTCVHGGHCPACMLASHPCLNCQWERSCGSSACVWVGAWYGLRLLDGSSTWAMWAPVVAPEDVDCSGILHCDCWFFCWEVSCVLDLWKVWNWST